MISGCFAVTGLVQLGLIELTSIYQSFLVSNLTVKALLSMGPKHSKATTESLKKKRIKVLLQWSRQSKSIPQPD